MNKNILKLRIITNILQYNLYLLSSGRISFHRFIYAIKKQLAISKLFNDSKYAQVGKKYFINPFAPYFPGTFFNKMLENNSMDHYPLKPNHAQIAITNLCPCNCFHCHVENTQNSDKDLPKEKVFEIIKDIIDADFLVMFFVGGEPLQRFDDLVEFIDFTKNYMDTRIFTSGIGADMKRLKTLRNAGLEGICVSLDHYDAAVHNRQRNNDHAFSAACSTVKEAAALGYYTSVVCCTTPAMIHSGDFSRVVDLSESLGAHSIQINEIRPVGHARDNFDSDLCLGPKEKEILIDYYRQQNGSNRKIAIVMPWYNEEPHKFGCMATAGQNVYVDADGNVLPCVLLKTGLGNIRKQRFSHLWEPFVQLCRHPVRECLVHTLREKLDDAPTLPLSREETLALWPSLTAMEPIDVFRKITVKPPLKAAIP